MTCCPLSTIRYAWTSFIQLYIYIYIHIYACMHASRDLCKRLLLSCDLLCLVVADFANIPQGFFTGSCMVAPVMIRQP